ncbi:MAG TPA: ATP-binding protein, partial [Polyangiaceae bacterium]|nr:ATP-binding protein [Polyangiaceae bacterium]
PGEVIRRLEPLLRRLLDERIRLDFSLGGKGCVRMGESQLEQVVMNLVTNAGDAVAGSGRIGVATRDVTLASPTLSPDVGLSPGHYVVIEVTDDGAGIAPEITPYLFEPFFTTRARGTGLGLATAYGIAKQCGGTVAVESELGKGATFRVFLPRAESSETSAETAASSKQGTAKNKVLVVEDEENVRRVLERALRGAEFVVFVASGAAEALQLAEAEGPFDVLVTDIVMPDVDGHVLAGRLRERWPGLRVLFISGYTQEFPLGEQSPDRREEFLQKPFRPADVLAAVRKLCG